MNYTDVLNCVNQSDIVLHAGGMVSHYADYYPTKTLRTNTLATENIVKAIKNISSTTKVVYIGSVAQTNDRNSPIYWGELVVQSKSASMIIMQLVKQLLK
jgi:nucleoside-diphosphate-sugar epimerase